MAVSLRTNDGLFDETLCTSLTMCPKRALSRAQAARF
nr:MAG TPA_asm: hypothetical protein [Caudoviricetes sp.]